jgi:hypothetical protein
MREYIGLGLKGFINLRVAMAECQAPYSRFQIKIFLALEVIQVAAFAFDDIGQHQRMFITPEYVVHYRAFLYRRCPFTSISDLKNSRLSNQVCRLPVEPVEPDKREKKAF